VVPARFFRKKRREYLHVTATKKGEIMEILISLWDSFWALNLDALIVPWAKANMIPMAVGFTILRWWAKRTPSTADDELIDSIRAVLPMMKKR
jgi:hypothetical protein